MRWQRLTIFALLFLVWAVFAVWQSRQHSVQRELIEETLRQQSHSVMNALVGGIRSHRRLGRFFETQLESALQDLVQAPDVRAVSVRTEDGADMLGAGEVASLECAGPRGAGGHWIPEGFLLVESFVVQPAEPGGGLGRGRWQDQRDAQSAFSEGGRFEATLLLGRSRCDRLIRNSFHSHLFVTVFAAIVLGCLVLAWHANVRRVEAEGQSRLLEAETRHFRELSQSAAGLAHETRNPLGVIRGWTQRFAEQDLSVQQRREQTATIIEECDRVTARINQFLAFARPCEPQVADVAVNEVFEELAIILKPDLDALDLTMRYEVEVPQDAIQADRELLRQALFNLLQNATDYAPAGTTIVAALRVGSGGSYRIDVEDGGPGVVENVVDSLFTPYFTTRSNGTGLGLAIVRRIAIAHGWTAAYHPRVEGGAVFSLEGIHG